MNSTLMDNFTTVVLKQYQSATYCVLVSYEQRNQNDSWETKISILCQQIDTPSI